MDEQPAAKKGPHLLDEADVGSGEKSPGQQETEALIERIGERPPQPGGIPPLPAADRPAESATRTPAA